MKFEHHAYRIILATLFGTLFSEYQCRFSTHNLKITPKMLDLGDPFHGYF
jgi:hypothetical protein